MKAFVILGASLLLVLPCVYADVQFTEVYPAPERGNYEWVEIFNNGSEPLDLSSYKIFDLSGNNVVIRTLILEPQTYLIATASSIINNSGDTLFLKDETNTIVHTVTTPSGITSLESYALCDAEWKITDSITQGISNELTCFTPTSVPTSSPTFQPTLQPSKPTSTKFPSPSPTSYTMTPLLTPFQHVSPTRQFFAPTYNNSITPSTWPSPTPHAYVGNTYSLEARPHPPFFGYMKVGTLISFSTCCINFLYSVYRYRYMYV